MIDDDAPRGGAEAEGSESIFDPTSFLEADPENSEMGTPMDSHISQDILNDLDSKN
ncbi:MAG: hypothetical protein JO353_03580 [Phycisphaerae bacterium]|nr:hypothetical protein [Phycisphaerae bacterium]